MFLIENDSIEAAFHFSVEEFFTRFIKCNEPVLMLWQTDKTVMLGNNQVVSSEVDKSYAREADIRIVRRSSGGGAIYTDLGTLLYTVIQPIIKEAKTHREEVAAAVIEALSKMGIPAVREGRNDILVEGRKISGFAQYTLDTHICTHGSLLYDTDLDTLTNVLIANYDKLHPKGITSIRSRVTNIKPYMDADCTVNEFMERLKKELIDGKDFHTYEFSTEELDKINSIYQEKYSNDAWNLRM